MAMTNLPTPLSALRKSAATLPQRQCHDAELHLADSPNTPQLIMRETGNNGAEIHFNCRRHKLAFARKLRKDTPPQ